MKTITKLISVLSIGLCAFTHEAMGADQNDDDWNDNDWLALKVVKFLPKTSATPAQKPLSLGASPLEENISAKTAPAGPAQSQTTRIVVNFDSRSEIPLTKLAENNVGAYLYIESLNNEKQKIDITPQTTFPFTVELQASPRAISFVSQKIDSTVISIGMACFNTHELEGRINNLRRNGQSVPHYSALEILLSMSLNPPRITYTQGQLDILYPKGKDLLRSEYPLPILDGKLMAGTELKKALSLASVENVYEKFGTGCIITKALAR